MTIEPILNRLKSTLRTARGAEALAFWAKDGGWIDAMGETLEHEEIVFYAEGMVMEGLRIAWQVLAEGEGAPADHLRLYFWQGDRPALPLAPEGMRVIETVEFPAQ